MIIGALGAALGTCGLQMTSLAAEHKDGHEEHGEKKHADKKPATVGGIWAEVQEHQEQLEKIIADKKLDKVHEVAFEIRDLVNALPGKSGKLDAGSLAKLKANAKFVADLAKRLDESGDSNDQAATEAHFKKLQGILKTIAALYPPEDLKHE